MSARPRTRLRSGRASASGFVEPPILSAVGALHSLPALAAGAAKRVVLANGAVQCGVASVTGAQSVSVDFVIPNLSFVQGVASSIDVSQFYTVPNGFEFVALTVATGSLPAGVSLNGQSLDYDGIGAASSESGIVLRLQLSDWPMRSAAAGFSEDFRGIADRAALLTQGQAWQGVSGIHYSFTGASFGDPDRYTDPPPNGADSKIDIDDDAPGAGKSIYMRQYPSEGAVDSGPTFEMPLPGAPLSEYYVGFAIKFDSGFWNFDFAGTSTKWLFLNDKSFTNGEVVLTHRSQIPRVFRVTSGAFNFQLDWESPPTMAFQFGMYPFFDAGAPLNPTTRDEFEQRYGYLSGNTDPAHPNYAGVPNLIPDEWNYVVAYINTNYALGTSPGIVKVWLGPYGQPLTLVMGGMIDADLPLGDTSSSFRFVMRPENSSNAIPAIAGCRYAEAVADSGPPMVPGGHALPYPGTEMPPNYPPAGAVEYNP